MTTATTTAAEETNSGTLRVPRVSTLAGFRLDTTQYAFDEADRVPAFSLLTLLMAVCLSAVEAGYSIQHVESAEAWRTLKEAPPVAVADAVRRVERQCSWQLPGGGSDSLIDRVDRFYGMAYARRRLERGE
jgi:hypothetical protein